MEDELSFRCANYEVEINVEMACQQKLRLDFRREVGVRATDLRVTSIDKDI